MGQQDLMCFLTLGGSAETCRSEIARLPTASQRVSLSLGVVSLREFDLVRAQVQRDMEGAKFRLRLTRL